MTATQPGGIIQTAILRAPSKTGYKVWGAAFFLRHDNLYQYVSVWGKEHGPYQSALYDPQYSRWHVGKQYTAHLEKQLAKGYLHCSNEKLRAYLLKVIAPMTGTKLEQNPCGFCIAKHKLSFDSSSEPYWKQHCSNCNCELWTHALVHPHHILNVCDGASNISPDSKADLKALKVWPMPEEDCLSCRVIAKNNGDMKFKKFFNLPCNRCVTRVGDHMSAHPHHLLASDCEYVMFPVGSTAIVDELLGTTQPDKPKTLKETLNKYADEVLDLIEKKEPGLETYPNCPACIVSAPGAANPVYKMRCLNCSRPIGAHKPVHPHPGNYPGDGNFTCKRIGFPVEAFTISQAIKKGQQLPPAVQPIKKKEEPVIYVRQVRKEIEW